MASAGNWPMKKSSILHRANGSLFVSSRTDVLTGIYNRLALRTGT